MTKFCPICYKYFPDDVKFCPTDSLPLFEHDDPYLDKIVDGRFKVLLQ